jgi:hypothetical protein
MAFDNDAFLAFKLQQNEYGPARKRTRLLGVKRFAPGVASSASPSQKFAAHSPHPPSSSLVGTRLSAVRTQQGVLPGPDVRPTSASPSSLALPPPSSSLSSSSSSSSRRPLTTPSASAGSDGARRSGHARTSNVHLPSLSSLSRPPTSGALGKLLLGGRFYAHTILYVIALLSFVERVILLLFAVRFKLSHTHAPHHQTAALRGGNLGARSHVGDGRCCLSRGEDVSVCFLRLVTCVCRAHSSPPSPSLYLPRAQAR